MEFVIISCVVMFYLFLCFRKVGKCVFFLLVMILEIELIWRNSQQIVLGSSMFLEFDLKEYLNIDIYCVVNKEIKNVGEF